MTVSGILSEIFTILEGGKKMQIPSDPNMLLSYVNLKLRDSYASLDDMCDDMDVSKDEIEEKLQKAGFNYDSQRNQFK